jgi:transcriptional regulator with XRE-family HTH domain
MWREICETASVMAKTLAPEVRSLFAKRLKDMRLRSGFPRARYFAKSLGIEENRYTRYERAEVEPNLTLIHKMCETLRVSPNELLGFAEYAGTVQLPAFSEDVSTENLAAEDAGARRLGLLAWRLASEAVAIRNRQRAKSKAAADPLAMTRDTGKLFRKLQSDPFGTVAEIAADDALKDLDPLRKAELAQAIAAFTDGVSQSASAAARS